ncbi:MAG: hypothetical protein Q8865_04890 [Bacillota bacterium]|nr:hypothetical protein [Bacillota bacterium]
MHKRAICGILTMAVLLGLSGCVKTEKTDSLKKDDAKGQTVEKITKGTDEKKEYQQEADRRNFPERGENDEYKDKIYSSEKGEVGQFPGHREHAQGNVKKEEEALPEGGG